MKDVVADKAEIILRERPHLQRA